MCKCTPSIKSPWCDKCKTPLDELMSYGKVKEIVKLMNGLSEEGYTNKYINDPYFHTGVDALVLLASQKGE
jgi:hypothetical protein